MQIATKFFGLQEIAETEAIVFEHGLPGFENYHHFTIIRYKEDSPFFVLQSLETADLAFILIQFNEVAPGFSFDISDEDAEELGLSSSNDSVTYAVVVLPSDPAKATVNLAGPIIIGLQSRKAKQIIINHPAYSMRHPLFAASEPVASKKAVAR
jgi:Uncharacterized protein conserved in bacteria